MAIDIHTPSTPGHLKVTPTMIDDFICDPVLGARVVFNVRLDAFQASALRTYWWTPDVIDSSGFGTGKSFRAWLFANLRCLILGDQWVWAYYQTYESGKQIFWPYYEKFNSRTAPIFAAQLGKLDEDGGETKDNTRGPACSTQHFKNGSRIVLPAPGWFQAAKSQAGITFNCAIVDEWTKVETMSKRVAGSKSRDELAVGGIDQQVIGRVRRECFNQYHPLWGNHRVFMATAESLMHPAARRVKTYQREINRGNPNYALISYNFKHFSNLKSHTGRPFKQQVPNWQTIATMKAQFTRAHFLREGLGIWARETSGVYAEDVLERGVVAGIQAGVQPQLRRNNTWALTVPAGLAVDRLAGPEGLDNQNVHYFLGGDPAPAQTRKADDGALVILRARPRPDLGRGPTGNPGDWEKAFVWAMRVRGETRNLEDKGVWLAETNRKWSGLIHRLHRTFGLSGIMLDPHGGGSMIMTELSNSQQTIDGLVTACSPIATLDNLTVGLADFILQMFRRRDHGIEQLWPLIPSDDNLYDYAHMTFQQEMEHAQVLWPKPFNDRPPEEYALWPEELKWALKNLDAARYQLANIQAVTNEDGSWKVTSHGAKTYAAMGKKDLAYAALYAYMRFLTWLKQNELEFTGDQSGDTGGFYVF